MDEAAAVSEPFVATAPGHYRLQAELNFATVTRLRAIGLALFARETGALVIDLSGVSDVDSAGLALLVAWLAWAETRHRSLRYEQLPEPLLALAHLSEVDQLLRR
jgi:phospholipid transport system transporter-binding protein